MSIIVTLYLYGDLEQMREQIAVHQEWLQKQTPLPLKDVPKSTPTPKE